MFEIVKALKTDATRLTMLSYSLPDPLPISKTGDTTTLFSKCSRKKINLHDKSLSNRLYVLKMDPDNNDEIENELKILKKLHHPNIIDVKCTLYFDNHVGILFEFMRRGDLFGIQEGKDKFSKELIFTIFQKLAKACAYCNKNNIIHADIKGDNILINENFEPILADFGLSIELPADQDFSIQPYFVWNRSVLCPGSLKF